MKNNHVLRAISAAILLTLASGAIAAGMTKPTTQNRAEIPAQYRWDFTPIYANWEAWDAAMKELDGKIDSFVTLKGSLKKGPAAVLKAYKAFDEIGMLQYKVYGFTHLQRDVDTRNQDISGKSQRVTTLFAKLGTATAWFTPELLKVPQATMEKWIAQTPALKPYKFTIVDIYRQQKHVLDEKGEKLLSYAARFNGTPTSTFQELSTSDIKFPKVTLSDGKKSPCRPACIKACSAPTITRPTVPRRSMRI